MRGEEIPWTRSTKAASFASAPIMMTTMAALWYTAHCTCFGAGSEARAAPGSAVVGGLVVSQLINPVHHSRFITPIGFLPEEVGTLFRRRRATAAQSSLSSNT